MPTESQVVKFEKMTYFACIASSWARYQFLDNRYYHGYTYDGFSEDEINEHQFLRNWWLNTTDGDKENIKRICMNMARDVPTKHMQFIQTTKNEHTDKVVKKGGFL